MTIYELIEQIDKLKEELAEYVYVAESLDESLVRASKKADKYREALESILEETNEDLANHPEYDEIHCIAHRALEPIVKVEHEGHLFTFGESTIEVEYAGPKDDFPFKRIKKGE